MKALLNKYIRAADGMVTSSLDAAEFQAGLGVFAYGHQTAIDVPESIMFQSAVQRLERAKAKRADVVKGKRAIRADE